MVSSSTLFMLTFVVGLLNKVSDQEQADATDLPAWLPRTTYIVVAISTLVLLVLHTAKWDAVDVNTTSLGLLALLLIVPLAPYVTKLKAAGLEAEIGPRDARKLQKQAANLPSASSTSSTYPSDAPTIVELIDRDPALGLARLRMDLEQELRRLWESAEIPRHGQRATEIRGRQYVPPTGMARDLMRADILGRDVAEPLSSVLDLANRAIHGEYVPSEVASDIAGVGIRVLEALRVIETPSGAS
jgi:hypothetical protein